MGSFFGSINTSGTLAHLKRLQVFSPDVFANALMAETEVEVKECKRVCPVGGPEDPHPGQLRDSIHSEGPEREGRIIRSRVVTGPESAEYALVQHEDLELLHRVGDAKYIERPLAESSPHIPDRIAARIDLGKV